MMIRILTLAVILTSLPLFAANTGILNNFNFHRKRLDEFKSGEVLVKFSSRFSFSSNQGHLKNRYQAKAAQKLSNDGLVHVKIREGQSVEDAIQELSRDPSVEFVEPNYIRKLFRTPSENSTIYALQWAVKNAGQTLSGTPTGTNYNGYFPSNNPPSGTLRDLDLENAWDIQTDCSSVPVAVIDTGVNHNHEDLNANMWSNASFPNHGYDFLDGDNDPMDPKVNSEGHGTHVSGIIGAVGNNGKGMAGTCWTASIMALRAGDGDGLSVAAIVNSINFAVARGAKVINMSFGGSSISAAETTAISNAVSAGLVLVAAAGNESTNNDTTPSYPCNSPGVLCVASLDQGFALSTFSNFGASSVHVAAPGQNIVSAANALIGTITGSYDDLSTGWTINAPWATHTVGSDTFPSLTVPATYDGTVNYTDAAPTTGKAYKTFNLNGYSDAVMVVNATIDTASGDSVSVGIKNTTGDPFSGGTDIESFSGTVADDEYMLPLANCLTSTCSFGFKWTSNGDATVAHGVKIHQMYPLVSAANNTKYRIMSGTSMASPYVAGVAALVWSHNPSYSATDVINAIKNGGVAVLSTGDAAKIASGKAVSSTGALKYIAPPTNVTATVH